MEEDDLPPFNPFKPTGLGVSSSERLGIWGNLGFFLDTIEETEGGGASLELRGEVYWGESGNELLLKNSMTQQFISIKVDDLSSLQQSDSCHTQGLGKFVTFNRLGKSGTKITCWQVKVQKTIDSKYLKGTLLELESFIVDLDIDQIYKDEDSSSADFTRFFVLESVSSRLHSFQYVKLLAHETELLGNLSEIGIPQSAKPVYFGNLFICRYAGDQCAIYQLRPFRLLHRGTSHTNISIKCCDTRLRLYLGNCTTLKNPNVSEIEIDHTSKFTFPAAYSQVALSSLVSGIPAARLTQSDSDSQAEWKYIYSDGSNLLVKSSTPTAQPSKLSIPHPAGRPHLSLSLAPTLPPPATQPPLSVRARIHPLTPSPSSSANLPASAVFEHTLTTDHTRTVRPTTNTDTEADSGPQHNRHQHQQQQQQTVRVEGAGVTDHTHRGLWRVAVWEDGRSGGYRCRVCVVGRDGSVESRRVLVRPPVPAAVVVGGRGGERNGTGAGSVCEEGVRAVRWVPVGEMLARVQVTQGSMFELSVDVFPLQWKSGDSVEFELDCDRRIKLIEVSASQISDFKCEHVLEYTKSSGDGKYLIVGGNQQYFLIDMDQMRTVESSGISRRGKFTSSDIVFSRQDRYVARLTSSGILALNDLTLGLENNLLPTIIPKSSIISKDLQTWIEFTLDDKYLIYVDFKQETINMYAILEGKHSKTIYLPHHVTPVNISWDDMHNTRLTVTARVHQNADVFVFLMYQTNCTEYPTKITETANSGILLEKSWHDLGLIKSSQVPQTPICYIYPEAFASWSSFKHTISTWMNHTAPLQALPSKQQQNLYFRLLLHPAEPLPFANLAVLPLVCLCYLFALLFADTNTHLQACVGLFIAFGLFLKSSTLMRVVQSMQELGKPKNAKLPYATLLGATCLISCTGISAFWFEDLGFFSLIVIRGVSVYTAFVLVLMLLVFLSRTKTEETTSCAIHLIASVFKLRARASEILADTLISAGRLLCRGTNNWFDRNSPSYGIAILKPCSTPPGPEDRVFSYHEHVIDEMVGNFLSQKRTNTTENTAKPPVEEQKYNQRLQTVERQANSLSEAADKQITSFQSAIVSLKTDLQHELQTVDEQLTDLRDRIRYVTAKRSVGRLSAL